MKHNSEQSYRKWQILWKSILVYDSMFSVSRVTSSELKECQSWKILIADALIVTAEINEQSLQSEEQALYKT